MVWWNIFIIWFHSTIQLYQPLWLIHFYIFINNVSFNIFRVLFVCILAASFAESFYGLRRIPLKPQTFDHGHHLPKKQERLSLFFLIVFPYIRRKMDLLAEQFKLDEMDGVQEKVMMYKISN